MKNPTHPGEIIRNLIIRPRGVTVGQAARSFGVEEETLGRIITGQKGITPEIAMRLAIATDTTAQSWLLQQALYDSWTRSSKDN